MCLIGRNARARARLAIFVGQLAWLSLIWPAASSAVAAQPAVPIEVSTEDSRQPEPALTSSRGSARPALLLQAANECRQFWMVNTRHAPQRHGLECGFDRITYWKWQHGRGWVRYSRDAFVAAMDPSLPTTFYVHGNGLTYNVSITSARRMYNQIGQVVPGFRLVLWTWSAEYIPGLSVVENVREKALRSEAQGYYLARLIDQLEPSVPLSLVGHSFGSRTVAAALHALAVGRASGHDLPPRRYVGPRPIQATLLAAAMDNIWLWPGSKYGLAVTQVNRMLITFNPWDRILRAYDRLDGSDAGVLGMTGLPQEFRLGDHESKVIEWKVTPWVWSAHRWARYANSPRLANRLRPYIVYFEAYRPIYNSNPSSSSIRLSSSSLAPCSLPSWRLGMPTAMPTASRPTATSSTSRSSTATSRASGAPNSLDRSIFNPPAAPSGLPAMAAVLCCGKMMAFSGQTRLHAGHPLRQLSGCSTRIVSAPPTPYTPNKQKSRHSRQFVQRL